MRERMRIYRVAESQVMGRAAVLTLAVFMVVPAVVQGLAQDSSKLIVLFGGMLLSTVWALALLLGCLCVLAAWWLDHRRLIDPMFNAGLDITGTLMLALAGSAYVLVVVATVGWVGSLVLVGWFGASVVNLLGRSWMLWQRSGLARGRRRETT